MKNKKFRISFNAPVVLGFVAICCVVTFLNEITLGVSNSLLFMTYRSSLTAPLTWLRFFTHVFGHSGWSHCLGNMSYLLLLGPMLEEKYTSRTLAVSMVITAVITSLVNFIFFPGIALCGASGIVFTFILLASFTSFREGEIPLSFILVFVFFVGEQIVEGLTVQDNISNMAHVLGGIVGAWMGYRLNKTTGR